jgi:hydroxyacylglutathione hydrolase
VSAWTELERGAFVRQSRAYRMNSLVLARDGHALVIDPGVLPSELDDIAARVAAHAERTEHIALALTHPHWDHVLGRPWFPTATTLAHAGFAAALARDAASVDAAARAWIEGAGEPWAHPFRAFAPDVSVRGTARVVLGPFEIIVYDVPGHCSSQIALFLPAFGLLAAADMLSDIEIPWLDGPPEPYRRSLGALQRLIEQQDVRALVPGHGAVAIGRAGALLRVARDTDYLLQLERRVSTALHRGLALEPVQAELAAMDYLGKDADYPMNTVHRDNVKFTYDAVAGRSDPPRS